MNIQPATISANNNTGKENQHPPKHRRPTHLLQNTGQCNHQRSTLHLQQERNTEEHRKLRKKRGLVEKKGNTQKQQGTIYFTKQKHRKLKPEHYI